MRWHTKMYFGTCTIFGRISRFSEKIPCRGITLSFSDGNFPQQRRAHFKCCCEYNGGIVFVFSWSVEIDNQWVWTLDKWNCTKWSCPMAFIFPSSFVFPSLKRTPRFFGLQPYMFSYSKDATPAPPQVFIFFHLRRRPTDIWNLPSLLSLCSAKRRHTWICFGQSVIFCDNHKLIIWSILILIINDCHTWWRRGSLDQQINICSLSLITRIIPGWYSCVLHALIVDAVITSKLTNPEA